MVLAIALVFAGLVALFASPAGAQSVPDEERVIDVVQVDGLLDPANAALIKDTIKHAEQSDSRLLVIQLAGSGAVDSDVDGVIEAVANATIPIGVWIGPSGADARGASALVALNAPFVSVAPGAGIGPAAPVRFDDTNNPPRETVEREVRSAQRANGRSTDNVTAVVNRRLSSGTAERLGVVNSVEPTLRNFIVSLDGQTIRVAGKDVKLDTADNVGGEGERQLQPKAVQFHKLDLGQEAAHTLGSPWVAYFLFVAGFALIVFEFFAVSVGIAGGVGAFAVIGACYGFSHLPVQWWAMGLLLLGLLGLSIDVQAGALGAWTFIGAAALVAGSIWLYGGSSRLDPSWWVIALVCGGTVIFMLSAMTAIIRARFSTPTIGREELVGETGTAEVDVAPDGVVRIHDALWRARTNRATPISAGDTIRVVGVEGIVLEVEPPEGGARDYRDRARRRK
jgi:membrane-bound serine protease (ClpP class)